MKTIVIIDEADVRVAKELRTTPQSVAFLRYFPQEGVRANPVCIVFEKRWLKVRLPREMWDWTMGFIQGDKVETPVVLSFDPDVITSTETVIAELNEKDFRDSVWKEIPTTEAVFEGMGRQE